MKKENGNIIVDVNFAIGNQDTVPLIAFIIETHRVKLINNEALKTLNKLHELNRKLKKVVI